VLNLPNFNTKAVTLRVGLHPEHADFTVHEDLLSHSPFFADALDRRDTLTTYIMIDGHKKSAFRVYLQWLYTRRLHTKISEDTAVTNYSRHHGEWLNLADAYLLGEYLSDIDYRDTVVDAMLEWFHETPSREVYVVLDTASEIYFKIQIGPLRHLLSDVAAYRFDDSIIRK
jgi:hypothetical protein